MSVRYIEIVPNQVFSWKRGLRVSCAQRVMIDLPGKLVGSNESIGQIVELSDKKTRVEFKTSENGEIEIIRIDLEPGTSLGLNRETEALIRGFAGQKIIFEVEES